MMYLRCCFLLPAVREREAMDPSRVPPMHHSPFIASFQHSILGSAAPAALTVKKEVGAAVPAAGGGAGGGGGAQDCTDDREYGANAEGELDSGCRRCNVVFGTAVELKLHFGAVHQRTTFECFVCNKLYLQKYAFMAHLNRCHSELTNNFQCSHCSKSYTTQVSPKFSKSDPNLIVSELLFCKYC